MATVDNAAMKIGVHVTFDPVFSSDIHPAMELLDNMAGEGGTSSNGTAIALHVKGSRIKACILQFWIPRWLSGKESDCQAGDVGLTPGLGRPSREGKGNPLQYSCPGNPRDRDAWWATVHGVTKIQTQLND